MHSLLRTLVVVGSILAVLLGPARPAAAQPAEEQFARGQQLFDDGKPGEALPLFRAALSDTGSPNARLYVARCLAKLGKNAEAYEEMKETVRDATARAQTEERYAKTRDAAAAELALLEPKVGKLIVALADENVQAEVEVADAPFPDLGVPKAVEPGEVIVRASAPGKKPVEKRIEIDAGATRTVTLAFEDDSGETPAGQPTPSAPDEGGGFGAVRAAGIAVAALGAGGLVAFAVTGSMARSKFSELEEGCGGVRCTDPAYADVVDEGKTLETVANVMAGVGGGLLAAGVLMIIFGGPDDEPDETARAPRLELVPDGARLGVRARFRASW